MISEQENEWTITAEWDLVCERAFLAPLITTTYFCGVMVICSSFPIQIKTTYFCGVVVICPL